MVEYKAVLYGDYGVGKTSLTDRLMRGKFRDGSEATIGAAYQTWFPEGMGVKSTQSSSRRGRDKNGKLVPVFGIWDTAGQERFATLLPMYLRTAHVILFCWDYNETFDSVQADKRYKLAVDFNPQFHFYLVITKFDSQDWPPLRAAEKWAKEREIHGVFYTSAKTGAGIKPMFETIYKKLKVEQVKGREYGHTIRPIDLESDKRKTRKCCF